jgi:hypothetical protein
MSTDLYVLDDDEWTGGGVAIGTRNEFAQGLPELNAAWGTDNTVEDMPLVPLADYVSLHSADYALAFATNDQQRAAIRALDR